jgi:hypothetical protein
MRKARFTEEQITYSLKRVESGEQGNRKRQQGQKGSKHVTMHSNQLAKRLHGIIKSIC